MQEIFSASASISADDILRRSDLTEHSGVSVGKLGEWCGTNSESFVRVEIDP